MKKNRAKIRAGFLVICMLLMALAVTVHAERTFESFDGTIQYGKAAELLAKANAQLAAAGKETYQMDGDLQAIAIQYAAVHMTPEMDGGSSYNFVQSVKNEKSSMNWWASGIFGPAYKDESKLIDMIVNAWFNEDTGSRQKLVGIAYISDATIVRDSVWEQSMGTEYEPTKGWCVITGYGTCKPAPATGTERRTFHVTDMPVYPENAKPSTPSKVKVSSIKISGKTSLLTGKSTKLTAVVYPSNASNKELKWSSSNTKYAVVSTSGRVTAKAAGAGKTVTITAKAKDGSGKKAAFKIKLKGPVKKITLKGSKTLKVGKTTRIRATVTVGRGGSKALTWSSSNEKYAAVSSKGVIKAKKAGKGKTVKITARAKDGSGKKAAIKIRIK